MAYSYKEQIAVKYFVLFFILRVIHEEKSKNSVFRLKRSAVGETNYESLGSHIGSK